jgi:hypothetical protein
MFAQLITGRAGDVAGLRKETDRWVAELAPGAEGYQGGTGGVTDDGTLILLALFRDATAARSNSDRPEQGEWWREFESHLSGPATFEDTEDVDVAGEGWTSAAGFVQVMQGQAADPEGMRRRYRETEPALRAARPDLLGVVTLWHNDGRFTDVAFFTSEAEAREAERRDVPEDLREAVEEMQASVQTYHDLRDPWHTRPAG